jgi:hypothetical protein
MLKVIARGAQHWVGSLLPTPGIFRELSLKQQIGVTWELVRNSGF